MNDYENSQESALRNSYRGIRKIKILVFGDHETGKSAFLSAFCSQKTITKHKKTIGCEVHVFKSSVSYEILSKNSEANFSDTYLFEFWELSGDKSQRSSINFYFKQQMSEFHGALFFFDCSNLKTLYSFHSWVKSLFDSKTGENSYKCLWEMPFVVIGNKKDRLNKEKFNNGRKKAICYLKNIFNCKDGENIIFLKKNYDSNELDIKLFQLFLNHLCIEYEMKFKESGHNSEYLVEKENIVLKKSTSKYTLNGSYLINRIKLNMLDKKEVANFFKRNYYKIKEKIDKCFNYFTDFAGFFRSKRKKKTIV